MGTPPGRSCSFRNERIARRIAARPSFGIRLAKGAVNHGLDLQGRRAAIEAAFGFHQLAHNHNRLLHGGMVDSLGRNVIRDEARGPATSDPPPSDRPGPESPEVPR